MSLKSLVAHINSDATADAVVTHLANLTYVHPAGEHAYLTTVFNEDLRKKLFDGGVINGRSVQLSPRAKLLKSALQRRHLQSGCTSFTPHLAYHITSSLQIAAMINKTGFRANGGLYGEGAYFYGTSQAAENYQAPVINDAAGMPVPPVILEVIIYARRVIGAFPTGGDQLVLYRAQNDLSLVKNPLVIFPTAVFQRGAKLSNTAGGGGA